MQGDRQDQSEFTIERGRERDSDAGRSSMRSNSSAPRGEHRAGQAEFDLSGTAGHQAESGMPERLRRKYYAAEAGASDEAKVYADPRGEYLAFKVSTDRLATRLEDAGVVRDMVSVAQHRDWKEVELRGSVEFRRTAWLEASLRGLSVRGYEPDPIDRAALAFRARPETRAPEGRRPLQTREAGASETVTVDGLTTNRPIDVMVMPPERRQGQQHAVAESTGTASNRQRAHHEPPSADKRAEIKPTVTIDVTPRGIAARELPIPTLGQRRADAFRSALHRMHDGDDVVTAARSQLAAIERALGKAIPDAALRGSVLTHAKDRIAEHLERGGEFKHAELQEKTVHHKFSPQGKSEPRNRNPSRTHEVRRER